MICYNCLGKTEVSSNQCPVTFAIDQNNNKMRYPANATPSGFDFSGKIETVTTIYASCQRCGHSLTNQLIAEELQRRK